MPEPTRNRFRGTALLAAVLLAAGCGPSPQEQARRAHEIQQAERRLYADVARVAAANFQLADPPHVPLTGIGRNYTVYDANVLPELELMRFLARDGIAIRQEIPGRSGTEVRFFIRDEYAGLVDRNRFHFGRWIVTDVQIVPDGQEAVQDGVYVRPVDVTLRLVDIPSPAWLNASVVERNLNGLPTLTSEVTVRARLPRNVAGLPRTGKVVY